MSSTSKNDEKFEKLKSTISPQKMKDAFSKDELVKYILLLRQEKEEAASYNLIAKRVEFLEKAHIISLQYNRRESIEISGIPENVPDTELEDKCTGILKEIGCGDIEPWKYHACHRLKNRKITICRFITRKITGNALHNRKKLKDLDKTKVGLPSDSRIYINESLCPQLKYLHYKVRCAYNEKKIYAWNVWKGKLSLKLSQHDKIRYICHINELLELNLANQDDVNDFFKLY